MTPGDAAIVSVFGKVILWEPPSRLALEWRGVNFKPGEKTFAARVRCAMNQPSATFTSNLPS
jgi:hypothetical protein